MCAKSWQTPRRSANDIGGVVRDGRGADLVGHVGLDPVHQFDARRRASARPGGKLSPRVVADFRIERHHAARKQEMRRRRRARCRRSRNLLRAPFPTPASASGSGSGERIDGDARRRFSRSACRAALRARSRSGDCRRNPGPRGVATAPARSASAATCTRWPARLIGVSRSTCRACATGEA